MHEKTAHIDTSLIIEQQKSESEAAPVRTALGIYVFRSSSTYAQKEFKRAWLKDLAYLHKLAKDAPDMGALDRAVEKGLSNAKAKRRRDRCRTIIAAFMSKQPEDVMIGNLMPRFRSHVAEAVLGGFMAFSRSVHHLYDGTGCIRGKEEPTLAPNETLDTTVRECKRKSIKCSVHKFFKDNVNSFVQIKDAIIAVGSDASLELQETAKRIAVAATDVESLCDSNNCSSMSDALIAVDGIKMDVFAANNPREWVTIARAIGKPLVNPVEDEKNRVAASQARIPFATLRGPARES